ncbi:MAG: hypothetical protein SPK50_00160 [Mobiluncus porci]|uniref:Uncharacterized protein n=1 Tax=Mobiluncus porci TaxID=2652278 RepID=A0A7K0K0Q1_9ACTO|nr:MULTISPECIES: hypothetical protein [Mobiluncus]MCI6585225.1 hypothetical protein [Mobiluncus sp.]MDD7541077.1 hypothetical protein [Mobiluncus porci]MDY5747536.1 hypothetical protein [Mobiluncus porci]MST49067.1 hypothetical protein [Mobiluncus porci]
MSETQTVEEMSPEVNERIGKAPNPSKATLRRRQNPFLQLFSFANFNWRILQLVTIAKFGKH